MSPPTEQSRPPDAMPFRLNCVPHPDPRDAETALAIQQVSEEYDALAEIAGKAEDGTLLSSLVASHNPETAARLQAFVVGLWEEQEAKKQMKRSYDVRLGGLKHEIEKKTGEPQTFLYLELPGSVDPASLRGTWLRFNGPSPKEMGAFRLHITDVDGRRRTFEVFSKGADTKDFILRVVVIKPFNL